MEGHAGRTWLDPSVVKIRLFNDPDWAQIWPILHDIIVEQETFPYDPPSPKRKPGPCGSSPRRDANLVADSSGRSWAQRTCTRTGPGRASTSPAAASWLLAQHEAREWAVHSSKPRSPGQRTAASQGCSSTLSSEGNLDAEKLYGDLGFVAVGTVPGAFKSPTRGRIGLHVLYRTLP